ncbi:hypothetical protein ABKV49_17605 [Enterobacter ludwigii]|uniref:hypothetical protein n=1 Tax=Enterobacter ludwigii TaxID=299767 RepID=UPI0032AE8328
MAPNSKIQQPTYHEKEMAELQAKRDKENQEYLKTLNDEKLRKEKFEAEHPEIAAKPLGHDGADKRFIKVFNAIDSLPMVTRHPGTEDANLVYINMGAYNLTFARIMQSISALGNECKRASAYSGQDVTGYCLDALSTDLNEFSTALKTTKSNKGKVAALRDATFGDYIDFGHAAKLMNMFERLCQAQGNVGYAALVTLAAPCNDDGDTLNIRAAQRMGLIR